MSIWLGWRFTAGLNIIPNRGEIAWPWIHEDLWFWSTFIVSETWPDRTVGWSAHRRRYVRLFYVCISWKGTPPLPRNHRNMIDNRYLNVGARYDSVDLLELAATNRQPNDIIWELLLLRADHSNNISNGGRSVAWMRTRFGMGWLSQAREYLDFPIIFFDTWTANRNREIGDAL